MLEGLGGVVKGGERALGEPSLGLDSWFKLVHCRKRKVGTTRGRIRKGVSLGETEGAWRRTLALDESKSDGSRDGVDALMMNTPLRSGSL